MKLKAAIYHFTNESTKRPQIYKKQLETLKQFAYTLGFEVTDIYCDKSLKRCERTEFNRFLSCYEQYDVLITKDFYHISKNTMQCMTIMQTLKEKGIKIYTMENGSFSWNEAPLNKSMRVATYCCRFGSDDEMKQIIPVKNEILKLYANKKSQWTIVDQYFDISHYQNNDEQVELMKLIENKNKYNILLVHNLNDIHWRTSNFCKVRKQLQLDIYSLQDGFLQYTEGRII